ncbi:MAG: OmpH family outer membrane protein [Verrucomicrobium sp.]|nr:OmpH family outer membrane protein [Verrucomicrobium sp.]
MKRILLIAAISLLAVPALRAELKIATVDLQAVFNGYYKTKDADSLLNERVTGFRKERDEMVADYQKMVDDAKKLQEASEDKTLSESARAAKQKAFDQKRQEIVNKQGQMREFDGVRSREFEDQSRRIRAGLVDEITKFVTETSTKEKFNLVIDKSAPSMNGTPVVLYSQDVKDITDEVIKGLNATKPANYTAPAAAGSSNAPAAKP